MSWKKWIQSTIEQKVSIWSSPLPSSHTFLSLWTKSTNVLNCKINVLKACALCSKTLRLPPSKWQQYVIKKNRAPSSILHEAKIAYYARNMFEAARLAFRKVNVTSRHIDRLAAPTCFRKVNVTSRHIDRLAAPKCCAVKVLTSRISFSWPWWIRPWSGIIC